MCDLPSPMREWVGPILAQVALTFLVYGVLLYRRLSSIYRGIVPKGYFKLLQIRPDQKFPPQLEATARNLSNLFELPVLFFLYCVLMIILERTDPTAVMGAWAFVATRILHSGIHITNNHVTARFIAFLAGWALMAALWIRFAMI